MTGRSYLAYGLSLMSVVLLQGCAAILGSKSTNVSAISQPPGAEVYLDGARVGVTPDTIAVESKKSHTMVLKLQGYKEDSCILPSSVDAGWVILDVLLGGLVGIIVDAASSEWNELTRKSCNLVLSPVNSASPALAGTESQPDSVAAYSKPPIRDAARPFRSSAPDEPVSETVKAERRRIVGDMLRVGLVTNVEQGPPGILRVGVAQNFHSGESRDYYFPRLASAYRTWTVDPHPLIVELWEGGAKIGEFTDQSFFLGAGHTTPLDCPEAAVSSLCNSPENRVQMGPENPVMESSPATQFPIQESPSINAPVANTQVESTSGAPDRSGFHFDLGLGGGIMDFVCDDCDFESLTGFSGYISLASAVGERTLLGIESTGWSRDQSGSTAQVYSLMGHLTEYLSATSGVFLRAGLGLVGYREETDIGDFTANAFGFSSRIGYELGTGGAKAVPYLGYVRTFGGAELKLDGEEIDFDTAIGNFQFGISIIAY